MQNRFIEDNIVFFSNLQNLIVNNGYVFPPALRLITFALDIYGSDFWGTVPVDPKKMIRPIIKEGSNVASKDANEVETRPKYLSAVIKSLLSRDEVDKKILRECVEDSMAFMLLSRDRKSRDYAYDFIAEFIHTCPDGDDFIPHLFYRFGSNLIVDAKLCAKRDSFYSIFMYGINWTIYFIKNGSVSRNNYE